MGSLERKKEEGKCGRQISKSREAGMSVLGNGGAYTMVNRGEEEVLWKENSGILFKEVMEVPIAQQEGKGLDLMCRQ